MPFGFTENIEYLNKQIEREKKEEKRMKQVEKKKIMKHHPFKLPPGGFEHSSTLDFLLLFLLDELPELGSSFKEIFLVAHFDKSLKLITFHYILHSEFTGLTENVL